MSGQALLCQPVHRERQCCGLLAGEEMLGTRRAEGALLVAAHCGRGDLWVAKEGVICVDLILI